MKKTPALIGSAIALTLVFYLASYYLLPGPPPSSAMVGLFAAVALVIVWAVNAIWTKRRSARRAETDSNRQLILVLAALGLACSLLGCSLLGCAKASRPTSSGAGPMERLTGTTILLPGAKEPEGFGLYSYALLSHAPSSAELPRYKAFLKALVDLPTAQGLERYVPKERINLTSIPLESLDPNYPQASADAKVEYILKHYDYARGTAMRASLATRVGPGPVLISVLHPLDLATHPRPVLVQDMTLAQASLMSTYVAHFVDQAGQEQFWQESSLTTLALTLRNSLETAATGLNLSKTAVTGWVKLLK